MMHRMVIFVLCLFLTGGAGAHHSTANFDRGTTTALTGIVTKFQFMNPHSLIVIDVDDESTGEMKSYSVFATSKVVLLRYGWRPDSIHVGDTISITGHPDRDDPAFLYMTGVEFADGTEWFRSEILE